VSATYNPTLPTDLDWVRFFIGDRTNDPSEAKLSNEEITALLSEEPNKYYAAARAGELYMIRAGDAIRKTVDDLSVEYSDDAGGAYRKHLDSLRAEGARQLLRAGGSSSGIIIL
jgi:hypothetical protein